MRLIVPGLILVLAACRVAPPALTDGDKTAIRAALDTFVANVRARRDSANALLYTENGSVMPPNTGIVEGRAAIRAWTAAFPPTSDFALTPIEIDGRGDLAYVRGTYSFKIVGPDGHQVGEDHGKFVEIRRKQPDGEWLIAVDIFNSDVPAGRLR
ncbi:MAG: YybH family protein [Gemmatimonadota bacterium]